MRKQIVILNSLLVLFLLIVVLGLYVFFTTPMTPTVMEEYDYESVQSMVAPVPLPDEGQKVNEAVEQETTVPTIILDYDYEAMVAENPDFAGWLMIPGTVISLPVVQASDNNYYLTHSFSGKYSSFGCLFFDMNSAESNESRVIHGHNMGRNREEMFSTLIQYESQEYAQEHSRFYFSEAPGQTDIYEVFAVLNFDINNLSEFNYMQNTFATEQECSEFIAYLRSRSVYETNFTPTGNILILSTCNGVSGTSNRLLVCAGNLSS